MGEGKGEGASGNLGIKTGISGQKAVRGESVILGG